MAPYQGTGVSDSTPSGGEGTATISLPRIRLAMEASDHIVAISFSCSRDEAIGSMP